MSKLLTLVVFILFYVFSGYPQVRSMSLMEITSPNLAPGFGTTQRPKSISGHVFGPACLPGLMSSPGNVSGGMSAANFIQSVSNQIEEIQSRRLPDPPSDEGLVPMLYNFFREY
jgi:hypothetical protein